MFLNNQNSYLFPKIIFIFFCLYADFKNKKIVLARIRTQKTKIKSMTGIIDYFLFLYFENSVLTYTLLQIIIM